MKPDTHLASSHFFAELRAYLRELADGARPAGDLIRAAAERMLAEFSSDVIAWDWEQFDRVCAWIESLELPDQEDDSRMKLQPYQLMIVANIEARRWKENGKRATSTLFCEMARGGAKTMLMAMILSYHLAHSRAELQFHLGAPTASGAGEDTANLLRAFARQLGEPLKPVGSAGKEAVRNTESGATIKVLPADEEKYHGLRSVICAIDEIAHIAKPILTRARTGVAKTGGQLITFSTPHHEKETIPYYAWRDQMVGELLEGHHKDEEVALIWTIDDGDPVDEFVSEVVEKANPGLGVTIQEKSIRDSFSSMVVSGTPATRADYQRQHLASFNDLGSGGLLDLDDWRACDAVPVFRPGRVWVGIDLSRGAACDSNRTDVCSVCAVQTSPDGVIQVKARHFMPSHRLEHFGFRSKLPLAEWASSDPPHLQLCPGRVIDPEMITMEIETLMKDYKVSEIAYDLWTFSRDVLHRWETVNRWTLKGRAQAQYVVPATEGLVDKVRQRKIAHGGDPILERSIKNARVKNYQGGRRPDKDPSRSMIDPLMALIYALSSCFEEGGDRISGYEGDEIAV